MLLINLPPLLVLCPRHTSNRFSRICLLAVNEASSGPVFTTPNQVISFRNEEPDLIGHMIPYMVSKLSCGLTLQRWNMGLDGTWV